MASVPPTPIAVSALPRPAATRRVAGLLSAAFASAIFTTAALVFVVEPMFTKMVLPLYGGSAEVWNTCVLFFQTMLLAGYLYAHLAPRWLGTRRHALLHVTLLALALAALPITVLTAWVNPDPAHPASSLLALLGVSLGAPFLLLSSTAPLLQSWFAGTDHPRRGDPYILYAASNLGSLGALLSYPFLLEPHLTLTAQRAAWSWGYRVLLGLIAACALLALRSGLGRTAGRSAAAPADDAPLLDLVSHRLRARWVLLACVPSSLMLGVTSYLTTDVAAVPLLWVLPLAIYLLTFVIAFGRRRLVPARGLLRAELLVLGTLIFLMVWNTRSSPTRLLAIHLIAFGVVALVCHGELARRRPSPAHLTEYYLWLAVGGALGGAFNVLVAPWLFNAVLEYPIMIVLACALRPRTTGARLGWGRWTWWGFGLFAALLLAVKEVETSSLRQALRPQWLVFLMLFSSSLAGLAWLELRGRPRALALGAAIILGGDALLDARRGDVLLAERNFYGVRTVVAADGAHLLYHGTTRHGAQDLRPGHRREPQSYYSTNGPLGDLFRELPLPGGPRRVAAIGLGTGTAAAYARPGDDWTFYEIDPEMERMARDPRYFTYLRDCLGTVRVVIGDGRLALAQAPAGSFDLIILDAFNSDAIPIHLLTREAVAEYRLRLAPGGALAFHLSNRHLYLAPVVARLAADQRMELRLRIANWSDVGDSRSLIYPSTWAVMTHDARGLGGIARDPRWQAPTLNRLIGLWTDDYSNVFQAFAW